MGILTVTFASLLCCLGIPTTSSLQSHDNLVHYDRNDIEQLHPGFGRNWTLIDDGNGNFIVGTFDDDTEERLLFREEPDENNVVLTLFTKSHSNQRVTYKNISKSNFNPKKRTKIILHGWLSSGEKDVCVNIKDGYMENYDFNVIIVDWGYFAESIHYFGVISRLKKIANVLTEFIMAMVDSGANPEDIHFIGHSLGAQLSGYVGKKVKTLGRITGLDPALPGFDDPFNRLNSSDAKFVDIVHTCGGYLGIFDQVGTVDFYPNGGSVPQPGCEVLSELTEACSHGRSWKYYEQSLKTTNLIWTRKCTNHLVYIANPEQCGNDFVAFGEKTSVTASGAYYLTTLPGSPYFQHTTP